MAKLMHAVQYHSYGGGSAALKHVEVAIPSPGRNEVLIKVEASSIHPLDIRIQKGLMWPFMLPKFPFIPASDVAGEVVEVGPGVEKFKPGDRVVAFISPFKGGGLAEYSVTDQSLMASIPQEVSAYQCAGLPVSALTAFQALTKTIGIKLDGTGDRKNILITAASGGVGHYAVQLAKLGNTHVTATCGARNMELVKSLGADEVIDYKTPEGDALKSPSGKKYDAVVHCAVDFPWSKFEPNLSINGKVVDITPGPKTMMTSIMQKITFSKKKLVPYLLNVKDEDLQCVVDLVKEGKLKTVIDSEYPLSKAEEGWEKIISGHATGKIIFHHI